MTSSESRFANRNKILLMGGYVLFIYSLYALVVPFASNSPAIQDSLIRSTHFISVFPILFLACIFIISHKPSSRNTKVNVIFHYAIKITTALLALFYFLTIPTIYFGVQSNINQQKNSLTALTETLSQQKQEISDSIARLENPSQIIDTLERFPSISNIQIKPGTSADAIRKGVETSIDKAIDSQLNTINSRNTLRARGLIRNAVLTSLGCALAAASFLALTANVQDRQSLMSSSSSSVSSNTKQQSSRRSNSASKRRLQSRSQGFVGVISQRLRKLFSFF